MVDGNGDDVCISKNFAPFPVVGDSYTARLGFEDRNGAFFSGQIILSLMILI